MLSQKILLEADLLADKAFTVSHLKKIHDEVPVLVLASISDDSSFLGLFSYYRLAGVVDRRVLANRAKRVTLWGLAAHSFV